MRFLCCLFLAIFVWAQDLGLDLSLDDDSSSQKSTSKTQDDNFLDSLELELTQSAKQNEEEDEDTLKIPHPDTPKAPPSQPTPPKEIQPQTIPAQETPQNTLIPQEEQITQESPTTQAPQKDQNIEGQNIEEQSTPTPQEQHQKTISQGELPLAPQPIPQPAAPQGGQVAQDTQTPPPNLPQSSANPQDTQAPLTSRPLQNTTPLPTKEEHLTHREKMKIITREELLKHSNLCDEKGDEKVCFDVGMIYYQGRSELGQNLQEAYYHLEKSCKGQKGLGCYEAGIIIANSGANLYDGAVLLDRACQFGDLRGCRNLAILYYNGQGVPKNIYQAFNLFKKGCEAGDQKSCHKLYLGLGNAYRDSQNYPKAKVMYEKACKMGEQIACNELYLLSRKAHPSTRYLFGNSQNKP